MKSSMIIRKTALSALLALTTMLGSPVSAQSPETPVDAVVVAQGGGTEPRDLEPRYKPVPPEEPSSYNSGYIFAMTRGVANSTMHPAAKVTLYPLTVVLDLAFFPFAAIGGFFG